MQLKNWSDANKYTFSNWVSLLCPDILIKDSYTRKWTLSKFEIMNSNIKKYLDFNLINFFYE